MSEKIVQSRGKSKSWYEAEKLIQAARSERNEQRQGYRNGHYNRNHTITSGDVTLKVPKLKGISFETAIIEWHRRRESSVEEALIEMYLQAYPSDVWRILPRLCGAARCLQPSLAN